MKDQKLVHFVEWKKIAWEDFPVILEQVASWGVKHLVAHPCWGMKDALQPGSLARLSKDIARAGLDTPACHAYWGAEYDICFCNSPENTKRIVAEHALFLQKLQQLNVRTYTMHIGMEDNRQTPWEAIRRGIDLLLPTAESCGLILALENGHENLLTQQELADLVEEYNHPNLGVCFDNGHAHGYGDRKMLESLRIFSKHVVTCHLHDNYGTFDDHNPPLQGNVDWQRLIPALKALPRLLHAETESGNWQREAWNTFQKIWNESPNK